MDRRRAAVMVMLMAAAVVGVRASSGPTFSGETDDWGTPERMTEDPNAQYTGNYHQHSVATDTAGNVHIVWYDTRTSPNQVYYRRWSPVSGAWSAETALTSQTVNCYRPAVACDHSGNVYVAWHQSTSTQYGIYYIRRDVVTGVWSSPAVVYSNGTLLQRYPSLACRPNSDNVHVVWQGRGSGTNHQIWHREYIPGSGWGAVTQLTDNASGDNNNASCAVDNSDNCYVIWQAPTSPATIAYRARIGGTWQPQEQVSPVSMTGTQYDCAIAVQQDGSAIHALWEGQPASGVSSRVWYRSRTNQGWGSLDTICDQPPAGTQYGASLAVRHDNSLHAVWYGMVAGYSVRQLQYNRRQNGRWGRPIRLTERSSGNITDPSVACDSMDGVHIVWYDNSTGDNEIYYLRGLITDVAAAALLTPAPGSRISPSVTFTPRARWSNRCRRDAGFKAFLTLRNPAGMPVYADSSVVTSLAAGDSVALSFGDFPVGADTGIWLARCSTYAAMDTNPANDTLSAVFFVRRAGDVGVVAILQPSHPVDTGAVVMPRVQLRNWSAEPATFRSHVRLENPVGTGVYDEFVDVVGLAALSDTVLVYPAYVVHEGGNWTVRCSVYAYFDTFPDNDTVSRRFRVRSPFTFPYGWHEVEPMPAGLRAVKDGGWLAIERGLIYASRGTKTSDFYSFDPLGDSDGVWTSLTPMPDGREAKPPYKGSVGVGGDGYVYATKGNNTLGFWRYDIDSAVWRQLPDVPLGPSNKQVKGGTDMVYVRTQGGDTGWVYLLKGFKNDFFRFNTVTLAWDSSLPLAPTGGNVRWDKGSWLALVGRGQTTRHIYAHKAKYHELWMFDHSTLSWGPSPLTGMPLLGMTGKSKKSKDGGCATADGSGLYALKGGNTQELWRFDADLGTWAEKETIPAVGSTGKKKRVKAGADIIAYGDGVFFALKGTKTLEMWRYVDSLATGDGAGGGVSSRDPVGTAPVCPSVVVTARRQLRYSLPGSGMTSVRVYDVNGRVVFAADDLARRGVVNVDRLSAGVYIVRFEGDALKVTRKLVAE